MNRTEGLERTRKYWNLRSEGYSMNVRDELAGGSAEVWTEFFRVNAPKENYARVLDIGCGPGFFSIVLSKLGHEVTAIDYTENMLREAGENMRAQGVSCRLLQMDAQALEFPDNSFDLIVTRNVTWNLQDPHGAYAEWLRVLRPGGKIVNADGNHFYYVQDPDYRAFFREMEKKHKHMEGIDTSLINELAEQNPLARELRPAWDVRTAFELGASSVQARILEDSYFGDHRKRILEAFVVIIEK